MFGGFVLVVCGWFCLVFVYLVGLGVVGWFGVVIVGGVRW